MADYAIPQLCVTGYAIRCHSWLPMQYQRKSSRVYAIPSQAISLPSSALPSQIKSARINTEPLRNNSMPMPINTNRCFTDSLPRPAFPQQRLAFPYPHSPMRLRSYSLLIKCSAFRDCTMLFRYQSYPWLCLCFAFRCHSVTAQRVALPFRYSSKSCLPALFTRSHLQIFSYLIIAVQSHYVACLS